MPDSNLVPLIIEETLKSNIADKECLICFENYLTGQVVARLECFCFFHSECIKLWFKKSDGVCPLHKEE